MSIRRHLKATLGLLAVGGVAFAGAAHADNGKGEIYIEQHATESATVKAPDEYNQVETTSVTGTTEGKAVQINTDDTAPNKAYIKQGTESSKVKKATVELAQIGKNNKVGDDETHKLTMTATGDATLKVIQAKEQNNNANAVNDAVTGNEVVSDNLASTKLSIAATNGDNTVTIHQKSDGNKIYVGDIKGGSVNLTITQEGTSAADKGGVIHFTKLQATDAIDLKLTQNGDSNKMYFGSYDGQSDSNLSQEVNVNSISGGIDQKGDENLVQMFKVEASSADVYLKNYNDSGDLSQDGSDGIYLNNVEVDGSTAKFQVTQGSDANTITIGDIDSSGAPADLVKFGSSVTFKADQSNYGDITLLNSTFTGEATFDIQQSGGANNKHNLVEFQNVTVSGTTDFTAVQEKNGGNQILFGTDTQSVSISKNLTAKITQSGEDNHFKIDYGTVKGNLTIEGYSDDTLNMSGTDNTVEFAHLDSGTDSATADTTIAMDISGDGNVMLADIEADGSNTIKMNINGSNNLLYGATKSNGNVSMSQGTQLVMKAGGNNDFDVQITGDGNHIGLHQEASGDNVFHAVISGSNNEIGVYQTNASGNNYVDIHIASSGNTISIYQDVANTQGNASVLVYQN